jgi:MYXO-CTERM domain-containing protein
MVMGRDYILVQSDLVAEGMWAARIELHNDAVWPNGLKRVELNHRPDAARTAEGAELYFAWSFYLPETLPTDPGQTIAYWESNTSYQQVMAFQLSGEDLSFVTRRPSYAEQWDGAGVATAGEWHRIATHIVWSKNDSTGRVSVWFDGEQVVNAAPAATLADDNLHFTQLGLLRGAIEFTDVPVIYLDDAVEGDSLADVRPDDLPGVMPDGGVAFDAGPTGGDGGPAPEDGGPSGADGGGTRADGGGTRADGGPGGGEDGGCGCRVARGGGHVPIALFAIVLVLAVTRARRKGRGA